MLRLAVAVAVAVAVVVAVVAVALVGLLPAVARAHHVGPPTVTLEVRTSEPTKQGGVEQVLTWNASCGDPEDDFAVGVSRVMAMKGRAPVALRTQWLRRHQQGPGTFTMRVLPGSR